ncbi:MAG TPA: TIGR03435 family protein [Candidatus Acidoferrales bacterium]
MRRPSAYASLIAIGVGTAVLAGFIATSPVSAQSTTDSGKAAGGKMSFDVASVKRDVTCTPKALMTRETIPSSNFPLDDSDAYAATGGLFSATRFPLNLYIAFAYKIGVGPMQNPLPNAPKWIATECFDIKARGAANATKDQMRLMMQSLLQERFKLAAHWEAQKTPTLVLMLAKPGKLGPELRLDTDNTPCGQLPRGGERIPTVAGGYPAYCGGFIGVAGADGMKLAARKMTMAALAHYISTNLSLGFYRPVEDQTGLSGSFDMKLEYTIDALGARRQPGDFQAAFIEALKDELGLKLESTTGPVDELVVDQIEEPSPN